MNKKILLTSIITGLLSAINIGCNKGNFVSYKGGQISQQDVDKYAGTRIEKLQSQIIEVKRQAASELLLKKLLELDSKDGNIQQYFANYMNQKKSEISDNLAQTYVFINKSKSIANPNELAEAKTNILSEKINIYRDLLFQELSEKYEVKYTEKPQVDIKNRKNVDISGLPIRGSQNAPITIVKFTDFQCPYCKRGYYVLKELFEKYKEKIKWVYADFPLDFHKEAINSAVGSYCAGEQNKFWEYHDALFLKERINSQDDLRQVASVIKLDMPNWNNCLKSGKYNKVIQKNMELGKKLGVSGTPAFFINGIFVSGAIPYSEFIDYIKALGI